MYKLLIVVDVVESVVVKLLTVDVVESEVVESVDCCRCC